MKQNTDFTINDREIYLLTIKHFLEAADLLRSRTRRHEKLYKNFKQNEKSLFNEQEITDLIKESIRDFILQNSKDYITMTKKIYT